ncbi:MAG: DEAD/DEAH box helicase family protein [Lachnospiraceae bacterium]|nr:DEAD/DEAH box helicase family protein [Lachnospiraceae bacterium]
MDTTLYQWQEECLERWLEGGGRGIVQAVTGSGKTRLALCAIDALEEKLGRRVLVKIVVPTSSLMRQWARALREYKETIKTGGAEATDTVRKDAGGMGCAVPYGEDGTVHITREDDNTGMEEEHPEKPCAIKEKIGLRGGGRKDSDDCRYMIYVINSARYELARQILAQLSAGEAVLLIADECHHYAGGENHLIFEFQDRINKEQAFCYTLGLTATLPSGGAGRALTGALGPRIYTYGMAKASAMKTICPFDIFHISLTFQEEEREEYEALTAELTYCYGKLSQKLPWLGKLNLRELFDELKKLRVGKNRTLAKLASIYMSLTYKRRILVCQASARISCARELIRLLDEKDKILVFGERIDQAEALYELLSRDHPGRVGRCHSKMGELANHNSLDRFRTGELRILVTCKSLDEGVDIPDASVGIILSGTSVQRQRTQRLGRIIRKKEGKERASLYYLHIEESSEDNVYLPDVWETNTFELEYLMEADPTAADRKALQTSLSDKSLRINDECYHCRFIHPAYDEAASLVMDEIQRQDADERILREARRCLDMGRVRGDWMSEPEMLEKRIREASGKEERNYWVCMKRVRKNGYAGKLKRGHTK